MSALRSFTAWLGQARVGLPQPGRPRRARRAPFLAMASLSLLALACGGDGAAIAERLSGRLVDLVASRRFVVDGNGSDAARLRFSTPPEVAVVGEGGDRREAVVTAPGRWWWSGTVPRGARLDGAVLQVGKTAGRGLRVTITALLPFERRQLLEVTADGSWQPLSADLSRFAGQRVDLEIATSAGEATDRLAWAPFEVSSTSARPDPRPNIVVVVVDTLRADRLTTYGADRQTSPNVDALLAQRGVVVERAYAQAPWTIPSMVGLFAARWPGEIIERGPTLLPPDVPVLPETLRQLGYETAGFFGNPVLHAGTGFHRGFSTAYCSDTPMKAMLHDHADHLTGLARRWLASRSQRPFFLYAHYVDPHDPYENPDTAGNRSPFYPEYRGEVTGGWVHGIYLGKIPLRRPTEDLLHLKALYDSEVRYFDRYLGGLVAALDPATRANTLFVLTADHGEELYDHRGWKHGRTLYEEQVRVPLVFRWDDRLPAGARVVGPARLIDVAPTLVSAAGGTPPASWQGRNLLPVLRGSERAASEPLFARHLADGPIRAAAYGGRWKLLLFDRHAPFVPGDEHQTILYRQEVARLQRIELYDLQADPQERRNQAAAKPEVVRQLSPVIHSHLGREVAGLRVLLAGLPAGQRVEVSLGFAAAPTGWKSYFLGPDDRVIVEGNRLRLSLAGEVLEKGVVVPEAAGAVTQLEVRGASPAVRLPAGSAAAAPVPLAATRHRGWPGAGSGPVILLWTPEAAAVPGGVDSVDPETRRRLEALGYAG
jgi:arylsulfatase